jgi:hypothetical protein
MECFETCYWFCSSLDKAMILFKDIIEMIDLPDFNYGACAGEFQKSVYGLQANLIPPLRQCKIKSLAFVIGCPIQIHPFASALDTGFIGTLQISHERLRS